jgi:hypothetical protein
MVGGIRSVSHFSAIYTDNAYSEEDNSFCQSCLNAGFKSILQKRMYRLNDKTKEPELIQDADMENFRQCYNCGDVVPIYEVKKEPRISDFVETTDNPSDSNPGSMETFGKPPSQSVGLKKYKTKRRTHKDPEIQVFLDKGLHVTNIDES